MPSGGTGDSDAVVLVEHEGDVRAKAVRVADLRGDGAFRNLMDMSSARPPLRRRRWSAGKLFKRNGQDVDGRLGFVSHVSPFSRVG